MRAERQAAQARVDQLKLNNAEDPLPGEHLREARHNLIEEMSQSPMHRLAAAFYGIPVEELSASQFETVKKYGVISLAVAFATVSMLASIVVHTEPHDKSESKISRAIRAWLARAVSRLSASSKRLSKNP